MPPKPPTPEQIKRSNEIADEVRRLVEAHRENTKLSYREIEHRIGLDHPVLLRIMDYTNYLLSDRSKWSLFLIGRYFGSDFNEAWLSPYIDPAAPGWLQFMPPPPASQVLLHPGIIETTVRKGEEIKVAEEDKEDFNAVIGHARAELQRRRAAKKGGKKRGRK